MEHLVVVVATETLTDHEAQSIPGLEPLGRDSQAAAANDLIPAEITVTGAEEEGEQVVWVTLFQMRELLLFKNVMAVPEQQQTYLAAYCILVAVVQAELITVAAIATVVLVAVVVDLYIMQARTLIDQVTAIEAVVVVNH